MCPIILSLSGKIRLVREWNKGRKRKVIKRRLIVKGISVYVEDEKSYVRTFEHSKILFARANTTTTAPPIFYSWTLLSF